MTSSADAAFHSDPVMLAIRVLRPGAASRALTDGRGRRGIDDTHVCALVQRRCLKVDSGATPHSLPPLHRAYSGGTFDAQACGRAVAGDLAAVPSLRILVACTLPSKGNAAVSLPYRPSREPSIVPQTQVRLRTPSPCQYKARRLAPRR
ncbi:hypothetical protein PsYK624_158800 [Phanerochaete sordida]|uniref:Uncharacterized protein n=1 Tax=Phanerochaete sordida TaxID=48140 RepID=A0A9P3LLQ5_9APHY|nr:hypothetical protein PsYK624_158800 [Phanerochaete sordida]